MPGREVAGSSPAVTKGFPARKSVRPFPAPLTQILDVLDEQLVPAIDTGIEPKRIGAILGVRERDPSKSEPPHRPFGLFRFAICHQTSFALPSPATKEGNPT